MYGWIMERWLDDGMIGWLMFDDWWLMNHMTGIIGIIPILDFWTRISEASRCWSTLVESDPSVYISCNLQRPRHFCQRKSQRQNFLSPNWSWRRSRNEVIHSPTKKSLVVIFQGFFVFIWLASHTSWQNRNRGEIGSRDLYGAGGWQGVAMCAWFLKFVLGTQKDGCKKVGVWSITLPETNSSPLKMDGWNTIGFFWAPALSSSAFAVHFAGEGIIPKFISQQNVTFHISLTKCP